MRPNPRQKIYKFYLIKNLLHFITFNLLNLNKTKILNNYFKKHFGIKNTLCINKGRLGAYLAIKSCIKPNKNKIILSPFTIFDIVNMVICAGGVPVFSDVDKKSITIDINSIEKVYDDEVAGILITHTHLINKDINKIINFTKKNNIYLIEDCAISFGTKTKDKFIGTLGDISFFSFGIFKFISSLNGGLIMTKDDSIYNKILSEHKKFKSHDYRGLLKNYIKSLFVTAATNGMIFKFFTSYVVKLGYKFNIKFINNFSKNDPNPYLQEQLPENYKRIISLSQSDNILKQLKYYKKDLKIRIENAKLYFENLKDIKDLIIPKFQDNFENGWINFPIQYHKRDKLINYLYENDRDLAIYFYRNCNELNIFKKYKNKELKNIKEVVNNIILLPTYPHYGKNQVIRNIELIKKFFNHE